MALDRVCDAAYRKPGSSPSRAMAAGSRWHRQSRRPQWLSALELGGVDGGRGRNRIRASDNRSRGDPPARNRGCGPRTRLRETNGPSFATAPGGGVSTCEVRLTGRPRTFASARLGRSG